MSFSFLFFFCKFGLESMPRGEGRGGGGRLGGSWVFGVSLDDDPLFLSVRISFKPFLGFKAMSSSFSELLSTWAIISLGEWAMEDLSNSPLGFESSTGLSCISPSSSRRNWLISASKDKRKEVVSSLRAATSWGERWKGSSMSGRSFRAKKLGTEMSIRASLGSPTLIAWPTSWNRFDKGSKPSIKWMARSYLSSLMKISDLSTLLRPAMLTRLSLGATCLLSAIKKKIWGSKLW